jgi:hypothetical protein
VRDILREFEVLVRDEALVTGDFRVLDDAAQVPGTPAAAHQCDVEGAPFDVCPRDVS